MKNKMEIYEIECIQWNWQWTNTERYLYRTKESAKKKFSQMRKNFLKIIDKDWFEDKYLFDRDSHFYYNDWYVVYEIMLNKDYLLD